MLKVPLASVKMHYVFLPERSVQPGTEECWRRVICRRSMLLNRRRLEDGYPSLSQSLSL